jgi:phospholipid/cholesterol/gamma-HCH transport system substrate-binding protein
MGRNVIETLMGMLVLFVAATFVFISYQSGNISTTANNYKVNAQFKEIGSLSIGSDVRVSGIKIGTVSGHKLDPKSYRAILELSLEKDVKLPLDSSASIVGDGLLGGKYVAIEPGGEENFITQDGEIKYTQDAVSFESLIGKFAFGSVDKQDNSNAKNSESSTGL